MVDGAAERGHEVRAALPILPIRAPSHAAITSDPAPRTSSGLMPWAPGAIGPAFAGCQFEKMQACLYYSGDGRGVKPRSGAGLRGVRVSVTVRLRISSLPE